MQLWIWHGLRLELPDDWEMLQLSRTASEGRCAFADRYQFRLELDWRLVPGPPDFDRMMGDYETRQVEEGMSGVERLQYGAWRGFRGVRDGQTTTRLGRHFPGRGRLVELVLVWPGRVDRALERAVADSATEEAPGPGERWRAFGLDLLATPGLPLAECTVQPAMVEFVFQARRTGPQERFGRRGLVEDWLQEPVEDWLERWLGRGLSRPTARIQDLAGHRVALRSGLRRPPGLLSRARRVSAAAWICPADGRLYSAAVAGGRHDPEAVPAGHRLLCCDAMGHRP